MLVTLPPKVRHRLAFPQHNTTREAKPPPAAPALDVIVVPDLHVITPTHWTPPHPLSPLLCIITAQQALVDNVLERNTLLSSHLPLPLRDCLGVEETACGGGEVSVRLLADVCAAAIAKVGTTRGARHFVASLAFQRRCAAAWARHCSAFDRLNAAHVFNNPTLFRNESVERGA